MCCVSNQEATGYPGTHGQCIACSTRFLFFLPSLSQALQPLTLRARSTSRGQTGI